MRNFIWSFSLFFCGMFSMFSQTKGIEKGTYLSTNKGQKIKLNLLEGNKYELVFYAGNYEIKGDSLLFASNEKAQNRFDLAFVTDKKAKKINIKFTDPSYYSFYIGTQKGSEVVQYQKLSDIKTKIDPNWEKTDLEFEIDKADYLYLVYEEYNGKSTVSKYALPKNVSEVKINYELQVLGDLKLVGFYDKKANELQISEQAGKNPLTFVNEKEAKPEKLPTVIPVESQVISNWTYPGKESIVNADYDSFVVDSSAVAVDSVAEPVYPKFDFKLKVENNLKKAIESTKQFNAKYLVVAVDGKNKTAQEDFSNIIKSQEAQIGYSMYDEYKPQYDVFNYYLAGADDKKWLKNNKISNDPGVFVVNGQGDVLAVAKSDLAYQQYQFNYYGDLYLRLQRVDAFLSIEKTLKNKKATDADLIKTFNKAAILEPSYDYDSEYNVNDPESKEFVITKVALDKKEVAQTWKKLIEAHQKDTKPNLVLAQTIVREIKNQGFSKQFSNEDRILNDTDFLAIDYLIKHYDAIEKANAESIDETSTAARMGNLSTEISSALQKNSYISQEGVEGKANQNKIVSIYKKLIANGKGGFDCYKNYFAYLTQESEISGNNADYLKEFSTYFNTYLSPERGNAIEKLDEMFQTLDSSSEYSYDGWNSFKDYHSNLCNSAAWSVVEKPANSNYIKQAILWSEYSLVVTKNNPYYLDTLAQLYYKDGQKQKAIETQTLAVKFLNNLVEEETASEIKEVLAKMQNGTY